MYMHRVTADLSHLKVGAVLNREYVPLCRDRDVRLHDTAAAADVPALHCCANEDKSIGD